MEPCQTVIVKLKNGVFLIVLDEVVSMEGTFQLSSEVNGRESWTTSSRAIWYLPEYKDWLIGKRFGLDGLSGLGLAMNRLRKR